MSEKQLPEFEQDLVPNHNQLLATGINLMVEKGVIPSHGTLVVAVPHSGYDTFFTELNFPVQIHLFDSDPRVKEFYKKHPFANVEFHFVDTQVPTNDQIKVQSDIYVAMNTYGAQPATDYYELKSGGIALANEYNSDASHLHAAGFQQIAIIFRTEEGISQLDTNHPEEFLSHVTSLEELQSIELVSRVSETELKTLLRYFFSGAHIKVSDINEAYRAEFLSMQASYQEDTYDPIVLYAQLFNFVRLKAFIRISKAKPLVLNPDTGRLELGAPTDTTNEEKTVETMTTVMDPETGRLLECKPLPTKAQARHPHGELIYVLKKK